MTSPTDPLDRTDGPPPPPTDERVGSRSDLLAEERAAGSDDPETQARAVLADSEERTLHRGAAPDTVTEHRRSEDTVEPT
jgi:hypothetical protein